MGVHWPPPMLKVHMFLSKHLVSMLDNKADRVAVQECECAVVSVCVQLLCWGAMLNACWGCWSVLGMVHGMGGRVHKRCSPELFVPGWDDTCLGRVGMGVADTW